MSRVRRRALLAAASALPLSALFARRTRADSTPLVPDPKGVLDLLPGFSYTILEERFADMSDGYRVPSHADGMACFDPGDGTLVLMRNHELAVGDEPLGPYRKGQAPALESYNPASYGGVTRLVIDARTFHRISSNLVLSGTVRNCSGGISPWGWMSCEETFLTSHGYVFLCATDATAVKPHRRIPSYGHFRHEACHVDPRTLIAYLTEDEIFSAFYRFVPTDMREPFVGSLQALSVVGKPRQALNDFAVGEKQAIEWVSIADPEGLRSLVQSQALAAGAAIVSRGEGLWLHDNAVYFTATSGGPAALGQIFRLVPDGDEGTLELIATATDPEVMQAPDNITVHPLGGVAFCEDGEGTDYIRGLDAQGRIFALARNARSSSEFAGACFDPTGQVLFVNIQQDGLTLAIHGPMAQWFGAAPVVGAPLGGGGVGSDGGNTGTGGSVTPVGGSVQPAGGCSCSLPSGR